MGDDDLTLSDVVDDELQVIQEIEKAINRKIPRVEKIKWLEKIPGSCEFIKHKVGFVVKNGHVVELGLYNLRIPSLPNNINQLSHLIVLDIVRNQIRDLPESLYEVQSLERIYAYKNKITTLSDNVANLINLKEINFGANNISKIPDSIGKLANLEILNIYENSLSYLPESIGDLIALQQLNVDNNRLQNIPNTVGNLGNLRILRAAGNHITHLPKTIGNLQKLTQLYLLQNNLTDLPENLDCLKNLELLNVSYNKLTTISCSFTDLTNLKKINLIKNRLEEVPKCLNRTTNEIEILLDDNVLKHPPKSIAGLKKHYIGDLDIVTGEITVTDPSIGINEDILYYTRKGIWHCFLTYPDEEDEIISCTPFSSLIIVHETFLDRELYPEDWEIKEVRVDYLQLGIYDTIVFPEKQGIVGKLELQEAYESFFEENKKITRQAGFGFYEENGICLNVNASGRKFPVFNYKNDRGFTMVIWLDLYDGEIFEEYNYLE